MKKKDVFVSTIKGLIIGVFSWISCMSIASMILSFSSYGHVIDGINNIKKKNNKDLWYVTVPIIIGICFGLLAGRHLIDFFWKKYQIQIVILFVGLFIGGIKVLFSKQKLFINEDNILIPIIVLFLGTILVFCFNNKYLSIENSIVNSALLGLISGLSFLIPGIFSFCNCLKNGYNSILDSLNNLTVFNNLVVIIVFIIVFLITVLFVAKIIKIVMKKNKNNTYVFLCSCMIISIIVLVIQIESVKLSFLNIFTCIIAFVWGYMFAKNVAKE